MKLWVLRPNKSLKYLDEPWKPWHDKVYGFVVRAETEKEARKLASNLCGDEGEDAWLSDKFSTCEELTTAGNPRVIMIDFQSA